MMALAPAYHMARELPDDSALHRFAIMLGRQEAFDLVREHPGVPREDP